MQLYMNFSTFGIEIWDQKLCAQKDGFHKLGHLANIHGFDLKLHLCIRIGVYEI